MAADRIGYVYHLTTSDRLTSLTDGLKPNRKRGKSPEWQHLEQSVDQVIPEWVALLGISRANSIFAHAEPSYIDKIFDLKTRSRSKAAAHLIALQVEVNPELVILCEAFHLNYVYQNPGHQYWNSAMTLQEYRQYYEKAPWFDMVKKDSAPDHLPYTLIQPEVLVPGPIDPSRITWFASSAKRMSEHVYESW